VERLVAARATGRGVADGKTYGGNVAPGTSVEARLLLSCRRFVRVARHVACSRNRVSTPWRKETTMSTHIDRDGVLKLLERAAQLVEVLAASEYQSEHLPGAISIPLKELDAETAAQLDAERPVIVYCYDYQ